MLLQVDFSTTWKRIADTVKRVLQPQPLERSAWNDRFSDIYSICTSPHENHREKLYEETKTLLEEHVKCLHAEVNAAGSELVPAYAKRWQTFNQGAKYIDLLYRHFNNQYIRKLQHTDADIEYGVALDIKDQLLEIGELALKTWREHMIVPLAQRLVDILLSEVSKHREKFLVVGRDCLIVVLSFVTVEEYKKKEPFAFYETLFERRYLEDTSNFYREKANSLRYQCTCSDYLKQIMNLLTEEELRSKSFLHPDSYKKVTSVCQKRVIFDHVEFLQAGCRSMIKSDNEADLLHMYLLLKSAPDGLMHMVNEFENHIKETGLKLVKGISEGNIPQQFVETMLEVYRRFSDLMQRLFHSDRLFLGALGRACTSIVNYHEPKQPCRAPELVCKYCDALLKKSSKSSTDEADEKLKDSIIVFRYIDDKDAFQKFYSRALAKRLIAGTCVMETEEQMINRLKEVCGYDFTSKLHSMFTDVRLSAELSKKFHEFLRSEHRPLNTTMVANILQAGAWPLSNVPNEFLLPEPLNQCLNKFMEFYGTQFSGRNLTWLHHLAFAEVKMHTSTRSYFITMPTYLLSILLLFNDIDSLTHDDISKSTKLKQKELDRLLQTLLDHKLLIKMSSASGDGGEIRYTTNESFVSKRTRFRISVAMTQREQVTEVQQTRASIEEDRRLYLQAAIVRIMKMRKSLEHNSLMEEVITKSRMRFSPSVSAIKKSIEALIEKCYIERAPDKTDVYRYLA